MGIKLRWWLSVSLLVGSVAVTAQEPQTVVAAKDGDLDRLLDLVETGADVNRPAPDGATPLAYAAYRNDLAMAERLLSAGADVDRANDYGATPLYLAAGNGDAAMVEKLLRAGADPDAALLSGETPLMAAANRGRYQAVELLLQYGADPDAREANGGQTALMWAIAEGHADVAAYLVESGADIGLRSDGGFSPLLFASRNGHAGITNMLLQAGADPDDAMPETDAGKVRLRDTRPKSGLTPLIIASLGGFRDVARVLLEHGADTTPRDSQGKAALHYAVTNVSANRLIEDLLAHGADPNQRVQKHNPETDYDEVSMQGATPLLLAAEINNLDAIQLLLEAGADPFITTEQNTNALMIAAGASINPASSRPDEEIARAAKTARLLVELGLDVNAVGQFGWTALHAAAYHGRNDVMAFLLEAGADPNVMDQFGQTPLSIAYAIVTEGVGDAYGVTPRTYRKSTAELLLSRGATPLESSGVKIVSRRAIE